MEALLNETNKEKIMYKMVFLQVIICKKRIMCIMQNVHIIKCIKCKMCMMAYSQNRECK